jgi:Kef-type K+ transport system membrane component KefB
MEFYLIFLIWVAAAFFVPRLLRRTRIPWVTAVIMAGILVGPFGLGLTVPGETMEFLSTIGLILLMFSAGVETKLSNIKKAGREVAYFATLNIAIPATSGFLLGYFLGWGILPALILGVVFGTSSVEVIIPTLKELRLNQKISCMLTSAVFLEDLAALILLAILLKPLMDISTVPLVVFPFALAIFVFVVLFIIPKLENWLISWGAEKDQFASQVRTIFISVAIVAVLAEFIGVHAIVGGFLAGLSLSKIIESRKHLQQSIFAISYGFLVPIFLLNLGMKTNIGSLLSPGDALVTLAIVITLITSKTLSGFAVARYLGFSKRTSFGMGFITTAKLSATLATAGIATQLGIFTSDILTAVVILSIVTIILTPIISKALLNQPENIDITLKSEK